MKDTIILGSNKSAEEYISMLSDMKNIRVKGYIDPDDSLNYNMFGDFIKTMEIIEQGDLFILGNQVNSIDIDVLKHMIRFGKHILIDGLRNWSTHEINELEKLRRESQTVFQFGNTLHGKPLVTTAFQYIRKPRLVKVDKYSVAPKPGKFDQWIFNQLAEEIDLVCRIMNSGIRSISARPMFLFGNDPDLLNIQMEFDNDAICQISLGRAIEEGTHSIQIFQQEKLFHLDFDKNFLTETRNQEPSDQLMLDIEPTSPEKIKEQIPTVTVEKNIMHFDSRKMELKNFLENIDKRLTPLSNLEHLKDVSDICEWISEKVKRRYQSV
jgi:hypothetical protein